MKEDLVQATSAAVPADCDHPVRDVLFPNGSEAPFYIVSESAYVMKRDACPREDVAR
jgi:hypothetical protein